MDRSRFSFSFATTPLGAVVSAGLNSQIVLGCDFSLNAGSIQFPHRDFRFRRVLVSP